jgi:hypothetical protein
MKTAFFLAMLAFIMYYVVAAVGEVLFGLTLSSNVLFVGASITAFCNFVFYAIIGVIYENFM